MPIVRHVLVCFTEKEKKNHEKHKQQCFFIIFLILQLSSIVSKDSIVFFKKYIYLSASYFKVQGHTVRSSDLGDGAGHFGGSVGDTVDKTVLKSYFIYIGSNCTASVFISPRPIKRGLTIFNNMHSDPASF